MSNGGSGVTSMALTDSLGTLTWAERVRNPATAGQDYAGIWVADVPSSVVNASPSAIIYAVTAGLPAARVAGELARA